MMGREDAILNYMKIQHEMTKMFLSVLLVRLQRDVPTFDAAMFLEHLYIQQSTLPNVDTGIPKDQADLTNKLWREFVDLAERAIDGAKDIED